VLATKSQEQQVFASLTLANDHLLVKTNQSFSVVQAQTGKALWSIPVQLKETEVYGSYATAVVKETVYLGLRDTVSALRLKDGEKIWSFSEPKSTIRAEQMLATDEGIYTQLDAVYALQPDNGRVIWKNTQITLEDAHIADGIIYAKQYKPFLVALRANDGKVLWQIDKNPIENSVVGTLVDVGSGIVYTASSGYDACYDNRYAGLYTFRANDGSRSWNYIDRNG
jgi:outer membrane protein assembly factor BamB